MVGAVAVKRHMDVRQPRLYALTKELPVGQQLPIGDHSTVQAALVGVAQRRKQEG